MFTGLVQHLGIVRHLQTGPAGAGLEIDASGWLPPRHGDSIAVDGCCLTIASTPDETNRLRFDIIHQTLRLTTLGSLLPGDQVNLESCVTPETLLGGHIVQGHVDGLGSARRVKTESDGEVRIRVEPPPELLDFIVPRGSIAINGVSLTLARVTDDWFEVALIPTTLHLTNLSRIEAEPVSVNLEVDCLVRAVVHYLSRREE